MSPNDLAAAIDALFGTPNVGREAIYVAQGDAPKPVRVVSRRPDTVTEFGDARLWSEIQIFDIRVSDVSAPRQRTR